jgi:hypothetical protein
LAEEYRWAQNTGETLARGALSVAPLSEEKKLAYGTKLTDMKERYAGKFNDFVQKKDQIADKMMSAGNYLSSSKLDGLTPNEVMKERAQFGDKLAQAGRFLHSPQPAPAIMPV